MMKLMLDSVGNPHCYAASRVAYPFQRTSLRLKYAFSTPSVLFYPPSRNRGIANRQ